MVTDKRNKCAIVVQKQQAFPAVLIFLRDEPARAGWDGPEQVVRPNAYVQHMEASTRNVGAEWMALLVPDWRIALLLGAAIIGLRQFRRTTPEPQEASYQQPPADTLRAA